MLRAHALCWSCKEAAGPELGERSREALKRAWTTGPVVVCDVVLAEVSAFFPPGDDPAALLAADVLLTRDRGFYRSAFSGLRVLAP